MSGVISPIGVVTTSRRPRPRSLAWPAAAGAVVAIALVVAFAGYRIWQAFAGPPQIWPDSGDYARSAVWAGSRPPLVPLLLGATGTSPSFVAVQVAVAIIAWVAVAVAVAVLLPHGARVGSMALVLAFASTTAVVSWDRSVLSESLALSSMVLLLAAGLWAYSGPFTWPRVFAVLAAATLFASARDPHVWVVWLLAAAVGVETVVRGRGVRGLVAALGLALCAGVLLGGTLASDRTHVNVAHAYFVRVFPYPDRVAWFEDQGMPNVAEIRQHARATVAPPGTAPVVPIDANDASLRSLIEWLRDEGPAVYARWMAEHPGFVLSEPFQDPERAYNFADGHLSYYAPFDRTELVPLDIVVYPHAAFVAIVGIGALMVGLTSDLRRRAWWWFVVAVGTLGAANMLIAWHGDGMETTRHVSVGNVQLRLAVIVLVVFAATRLPRRRRATTGVDERDRPELEHAT